MLAVIYSSGSLAVQCRHWSPAPFTLRYSHGRQDRSGLRWPCEIWANK